MPQSPIEVERKWLVRDPPDLSKHQGMEVNQGYIAIAADGTEVRLRQADGRFFQTVKSAGGLVRDEIEIELTHDQFEALWRATAGRRLRKTRYTLPLEGKTAEIDVYHDSLNGLMVAEIEFTSAGASLQFTPPSWFGPEVTEDRLYKNISLALHGRPSP